MTLTIIGNGTTISAPAESGERLIDALSRAGKSISAPCGGRCFCGKCQVRTAGALSDITDAERGFISNVRLSDGWRLACACRIEGDATVYVEDADASVLVEGIETRSAFDPPYRVVEVELEKPSLTRQISDASRLFEKTGATEISDSALERLPEAARAGNTIFAEIFASKVLAVSENRPKSLGAAIDIGTTTMAAYLIDLQTGKQLATASSLNPQKIHGGDVISRADYTMKSDIGLFELKTLVRKGVSELIDEMLEKVGAKRENVKHIVTVGNTIMMHLFAGLCVKYIATLPFVSVYSAMRHMRADSMDMPFKNATVTIGPCLAGYVGADTVTAALACSMDNEKETVLMIDIGTNGEIALCANDRIWCCSAAAGPAFEGAHIKNGSGAVLGAVDSVKIENGVVSFTTIGGVKPTGVCGSGIISALSEMLNAEIIDETGRMTAPEYTISGDISITQKDVREVQLAKAAIAAGIGVLIDEAGIKISDIGRVYLAGGFGNFIDIPSACNIGLLPKELLGKIKGVGNAAGMGAKLLLTDKSMLERAQKLSERMKYVELSASVDFQERFADEMLFE